MKTFLLALLVIFSGTRLQADSLWVHHIGVGQGDATLIVAWQSNLAGGVDTTSILIDAGNSVGKGRTVFAYINDVLGDIRHINFVITSHLHSDHIGGMPAVLQGFVDNDWRVDFIIDRGANQALLKDSCYSDDGYEENDSVEPVSLPGSGIYTSYEALVNNHFDGKRSNIMPGDNLFRALARRLNMSMMCVAANGCALKTYNDPGYLPCPPNPSPDENDFSFGFLLEFEGFKYFTAGDIGGGGHYLDLETPLIPYFQSYPIMDFHFCGYKASHHGSAYSNNTAFINYTEPQFTVVPSALRSFSGTQLPGQTVIQRLQALPSYLAYTYHYTTQPYSGTVSEYYDVKYRVSNPGFNANINIPLYSRTRSKTSPYGVTSAYALLNAFVCTKYHDQPDLLQADVPGNVKKGVKSRDLPPRKVKKILRLKRKARRFSDKGAVLMRSK